MGSEFLELLKRVTVFMLVCQMLLHLLPSGGYEKYVKMLVRIMILAQLVVPVLSLGSFPSDQVFAEAMEEYGQEMERITGEIQALELEGTDYVQQGLEEAVGEKLAAAARDDGAGIVSISAGEDGILRIGVRKTAESASPGATSGPDTAAESAAPEAASGPEAAAGSAAPGVVSGTDDATVSLAPEATSGTDADVESAAPESAVPTVRIGEICIDGIPAGEAAGAETAGEALALRQRFAEVLGVEEEKVEVIWRD